MKSPSHGHTARSSCEPWRLQDPQRLLTSDGSVRKWWRFQKPYAHIPYIFIYHIYIYTLYVYIYTYTSLVYIYICIYIYSTYIIKYRGYTFQNVDEFLHVSLAGSSDDFPLLQGTAPIPAAATWPERMQKTRSFLSQTGWFIGVMNMVLSGISIFQPCFWDMWNIFSYIPIEHTLETWIKYGLYMFNIT